MGTPSCPPSFICAFTLPVTRPFTRAFTRAGVVTGAPFSIHTVTPTSGGPQNPGGRARRCGAHLPHPPG